MLPFINAPVQKARLCLYLELCWFSMSRIMLSCNHLLLVVLPTHSDTIAAIKSTSSKCDMGVATNIQISGGRIG